MDADFGDSHIHTSAKEVTNSELVIVLLGVIVFKVIRRQLNWILVKWPKISLRGLNVTVEDRCNNLKTWRQMCLFASPSCSLC